MKLKIEESSDTRTFDNMPVTYRVSLDINRGVVTLKRMYFRVGFSDGEQFDKFYFDNEWGGRQHSPLHRCTFITRKLNDKAYLMRKEEEMTKLFYEKCVRSKKYLEKELKKTTKEINDDINNYDDIINHFEYTQRGDKLKKIKNKLK